MMEDILICTDRSLHTILVSGIYDAIEYGLTDEPWSVATAHAASARVSTVFMAQVDNKGRNEEQCLKPATAIPREKLPLNIYAVSFNITPAYLEQSRQCPQTHVDSNDGEMDSPCSG